MKKLLFTMLLAAMAVADAYAQEIAVVTEDGATTIYRSLDEAIAKATDGCVIYLPGGGIPISDTTKVTKQVTIIGVTHKSDTDNADGATRIGGSLKFATGSDGSALMGVYVYNDVCIGTNAEDAVNCILIRYCDINSVQVRAGRCEGIVVDQSFLRGSSDFNNTNAMVTNCVVGSLYQVGYGLIDHNVFSGCGTKYTGSDVATNYVNNSTITNNIIFSDYYRPHYYNSHNFVSHNMYVSGNLEDIGENAMFVDQSKMVVDFSHGISPLSDFHLADSIGIGAATDGTDIGIYGGTGFKDNCVAPVPRIVTKDIPKQTDANGKLKIRIEAEFD